MKKLHLDRNYGSKKQTEVQVEEQFIHSRDATLHPLVGEVVRSRMIPSGSDG